ncbi:MAG: putative membrane protein affecting hemolysin expression [Candidatus Azotimanducaceae bacterium]|jgi:uncharacterized membrane protein affecting hemolysin expression
MNPRVRLLWLAILPLILSVIAMSLVVTVMTEKRMQTQSEHFSRTLTSYLAMTIAEHLVNNDLLGISVLLTRMQEDSALDFASVYDANNQLIAQVGRRGIDQSAVFSREITFQDTTAGYVQVGFSTKSITAQSQLALGLVVVFHIVLGLIVSGLILFAGDFLAIWVLGRQSVVPRQDSEIVEIEQEQAEVLETQDPSTAILVLKLRPARLIEKHRTNLNRGIGLYGGQIMDHDGDDLLILFTRSNAIFNSACAALLLLSLVELLGPPLKLKVGMHWLSDTSDDVVLEKATKHASYLASIGEQAVLVSRAYVQSIGAQAITNEHSEIEYDAFHSSLTPDGEVFQVKSVKNQELINRQALHLLNG